MNNLDDILTLEIVKRIKQLAYLNFSMSTRFKEEDEFVARVYCHSFIDGLCAEGYKIKIEKDNKITIFEKVC